MGEPSGSGVYRTSLRAWWAEIVAGEVDPGGLVGGEGSWLSAGQVRAVSAVVFWPRRPAIWRDGDEVELVDEHVQALSTDDEPDLVAIGACPCVAPSHGRVFSIDARGREAGSRRIR